MQSHARGATGPLIGELVVPGDKSLSHRAVLFAAMAEGESHLTGVLDSADVRATIAAVTTLGSICEVTIAPDKSLSVTVTGWGAPGPVSPVGAIDCGNSGTTARLLLGVLAGYPGLTATLTGDESLSKRPMRRVTAPLELMGAQFVDRDGCLPVTVAGAQLTGIKYESPVASAQVKTAVLLAGIQAMGRTTVTEPAPSRDHTERLLPSFGIEVGRDEPGNKAWVLGPAQLRASDVVVPADPSSAAFMVVGALLIPGSEITLPNVALNPTRIGFLRVLERMGADLEVTVSADASAEIRGAVVARYSPDLKATTVTATEIPSLVDEVPVLAVAAARAGGTTRFEGVEELRVKESDRLAAIADALGAMGVEVHATNDSLEITGPAHLRPAQVDSLGDHRLAMAWAIAALALAKNDSEMLIDRFEAVDVSYPDFLEHLGRLGAR